MNIKKNFETFCNRYDLELGYFFLGVFFGGSFVLLILATFLRGT